MVSCLLSTLVIIVAGKWHNKFLGSAAFNSESGIIFTATRNWRFTYAKLKLQGVSWHVGKTSSFMKIRSIGT